MVATVPPGLRFLGPSLLVGDLIIAIDERPIASPLDVTTALRQLRQGTVARVKFRRAGAAIETSARIVPAPVEQADDFRIDYLTLSIAEGRRHAVMTRPMQDGRHPVVLIIGGLGCYPVDQPFNPNEAQRALAHALTRAGYATLRVEKSGAGDSEGPACATTGMDVEVRGLVAGLRMLKQRPDIDPDQTFILGISMGGIVGPKVAAIEKVSGLLMFEIVGGTSWFEYELENRRRQLGLRGQNAASIHDAVTTRVWCLMHVMVDGRPRAEVIAERSACERELRYPVGDRYMQDVFAANIPQLYIALGSVPVLVVYGSADFITSSAQHEMLRDALNEAHPGRTTYVEIAAMDHWLSRASDQRESFKRAVDLGRPIGTFNPEAAKIAIQWLNKTAARAGGSSAFGGLVPLLRRSGYLLSHFSLEREWADAAKVRVAATAVVEAIDVLEDGASAWRRVGQFWRQMTAAFSDLKNVSTLALS
jgi:hypothetical protein